MTENVTPAFVLDLQNLEVGPSEGLECASACSSNETWFVVPA